MKLGSYVAIYFIIWWTVLFAVLPFGVRSNQEDGRVVEPGHDAGAPARANLLAKIVATTIISAILLVFVAWALNTQILSGQNP
jgi:predicted secreted protein